MYLQNPFYSFWMAGYECTDKLNAFGNRVDFLNVTGHLDMIDEDYARLKRFNISTVREGIRWSHIEKKPYQYDWSAVTVMIESAKRHGIQQIWDMCHFGFPDDLTPLHPMFARRFAALCRAFVVYYRSINPASTLIITPINEVSFLSWLGGDARGTSPYCINMGWEVKYYLMRAYIEGVAAMKEIDPGIRILTTEPLVNMVPPLDATAEQKTAAAEAHECQYQVLDILSGRICPELGGKPEYLDILGFNFYYNNQWINGTGQFLPWANEEPDPRFKPLSDLLIDCYRRYGRPIALTETSHPGEHRPNWIEKIGKEATIVLEKDIPLWGICLYPIIDRPDWDDLSTWHGSGLWDADMQHGTPKRILYTPYADALLEAQALVHQTLLGRRDRLAIAG
jgi:hypothetical protein